MRRETWVGGWVGRRRLERATVSYGWVGGWVGYLCFHLEESREVLEGLKELGVIQTAEDEDVGEELGEVEGLVVGVGGWMGGWVGG